jgi:hypothetical protein
MAKRSKRPTRAGRATVTSTSHETTAEAMELRVVAFAEQLGRMVGSIQAKAEGWMDRETLNRQLASVRDGAVHLLEQLARTATTTTKQKPPAAARGGSTGRSGGVVDAPGKKHRKQAPSDPGGTIARSQAAKTRTAMPMAKTTRHRGRG